MQPNQSDGWKSCALLPKRLPGTSLRLLFAEGLPVRTHLRLLLAVEQPAAPQAFSSSNRPSVRSTVSITFRLALKLAAAAS